MASRARARLGIALTATAVLAGACSSSSGGVSQSKLESKLKQEPSIHALLQQGGTKADVTNGLVSCIAKALEKDADSGDLTQYVDGKKNLDDVGGKSKGSANDAQADAKTCAQGVAAQASSSPTG